MTLDGGVAYGEAFREGDAALRFDGSGVRLDSVSLAKSNSAITGAAFVGWDSTYSFDATGRRLPIRSPDALRLAEASAHRHRRVRGARQRHVRRPAFDVKFASAISSTARKASADVSGTLVRRGKELNGEVAAQSGAPHG